MAAEIQRAWTIYPASDNTPTKDDPKRGETPRFVEVTETRDGDEVILSIQHGSHDDFTLSVILTAAEWRELTQLPVRFKENAVTT